MTRSPIRRRPVFSFRLPFSASSVAAVAAISTLWWPTSARAAVSASFDDEVLLVSEGAFTEVPVGISGVGDGGATLSLSLEPLDGETDLLAFFPDGDWDELSVMPGTESVLVSMQASDGVEPPATALLTVAADGATLCETVVLVCNEAPTVVSFSDARTDTAIAALDRVAAETGSPLEVSLRVSDPSAPDAARLSASLSWGDGATDQVPIRVDMKSGGFEATGTVSHAYAAAGNYRAVLFVSDKDGAAVSRVFYAVVAEGEPPPTPLPTVRFFVGDVEIESLEIDEGPYGEGPLVTAVLSETFSTNAAVSVSAVGAGADESDAKWYLEGAPDTLAPGESSFEFAVCGLDGLNPPQTGHVVVFFGDSEIGRLPVTIRNIPPVFESIAATCSTNSLDGASKILVGERGSQVAVEAIARKVEWWYVQEGGRMCSVDWGDGTIVAAVPDESYGQDEDGRSAQGRWTASHTYDLPDFIPAATSFPARVTVTDKDGGSVSDTFTVQYAAFVGPVIATEEIPAFEARSHVAFTFEAEGLNPPFSWSMEPYFRDKYTMVRSASSFSSRVGSAVSGTSGDDVCGSYTLPFAFPFCGKAYTTVWVNSNGTLNFDGSFTTYSPTESTLRAHPMIAVLWRDLRMSSGVYVYRPSNDSVRFQWTGSYYNTSPAVDFSATLYADGRIVASYGSGNTNGGFVGVSDGAGFITYENVTASLSNAQDFVFRPFGGADFAWATFGEDGTVSGRPPVPFTNALSVVVSDSAGRTDSAVFDFRVFATTNRHPVVSAWTPDVNELQALVGEEIVFSVDAFDPENESLQYRWTINGSPVSGESAETFAWTPSASERGANTVRCFVSDGWWDWEEAAVWNVCVYDWYVSPDGSDSASGMSSQTPFATLQKAIDSAAPGDTIYVMGGSYTPVSTGNKSVTLLAAAGEAPVIDGGGTNRCVYVGNGSNYTNTVFRGFTLRNGYSGNANGGGAMGGTFIDCTIENCRVNYNSGYYGGGTFYANLENCIVQNCRAYYGGGVSYGTIRNCVIRDCEATYYGGGAYYGTLSNCTVRDNMAGTGSGTYGSTLVRSTVARNRASNFQGMYQGGLSYGISWDNWFIDGIVRDTWRNNSMSVDNSCFAGGYSGTGNISSDPLLVETADGHLVPHVSSPALGMGPKPEGATGVLVRTTVSGPGRVSPSIAVEPGSTARVTATLPNRIHAFSGFTVGGVAATEGVTTNGLDYTLEFSVPEDATRIEVVARFSAISLYVAPDGDDANDGLSWETARRTIQSAVDSAVSYDTVFVTNGTYSAFSATNNLSLSIRSVEGAEKTVIDGGGSKRPATLGAIQYHTTTDLRGFTLRNGYASQSGGGAYGGTLRNCVLSGNRAGGGSSSYGGGGSAYSLLYDCTVTNNSATYGGGTYYGTLYRCAIAGNNASNGGGSYKGMHYDGRYSGNTAAQGGGANETGLMRCTIEYNTSSGLGGGCFSGGATNCLIRANSASHGGGVYSATAVNCQLSDNRALQYAGGAYSSTLVNCTIVGNSAPADPGRGGGTATRCVSWNNTFTGHSESADDGQTNPMLVLGDDGLCRLSAHSPLIDAGGTVSGLPARDLAGNARVQGAGVDFGAVEGGVAGNWVGLANDGYGEASANVAVADGESVTLTATQGDEAHAFLGFFVGGEPLAGVVSDGLTHSVTFTPTAETTEVVARFERRTFHVSPDGDDAADGRSWETAKKTINGALACAHTCDTVLCADGTYAPFTFSRNDFITIRSVNGYESTIIDGGNASRCATFGGASTIPNDSNAITNAVLEGFTLRNGKSGNGGGAQYGTIQSCRFESNVATSEGGGMQYGVAYSCGFWNNSANYGGGASRTTLRNCTVSKNRATTEGGGCYGLVGYNTVAYGNTAGTSSEFSAGCMMYRGCNGGTSTANNSMATNPCLVYADAGDLRIRTSSPCIDAGYNQYVVASADITGAARVQNGTVDIGAYEGGVSGFVVGTAIVGSGDVSPKYILADAADESLPHDATFTAVETDRPFLGFSTNGVFVSAEDVGDTLTWRDVDADATVTLYFATNIYVNAATGDDANGGFTPETAKKTLQVAIDLAKAGETVFVAPGTYAPVTTGNKSIRVIATEGWEKTAIDGGGTNRCVFVGNGQYWDTVFEGFTIQNGRVDGSGAGTMGGTFRNCFITGNVSAGNYSGGGAGWSVLENCLVTGNSSYNGGGMVNGKAFHCTIVGNFASYRGGGCNSTETRNSIVWGNTSPNSYSNSYSCTTTYSCVGGGASGTGNISSDPRFVDAENGDYRLLDHSPCIDAASASYVTDGATDLLGNPRVVGAAPDMGCHEGGVELPLPATPSGFEAADGRKIGFVRLSWNAADWAWSYRVERASESESGVWTALGTTDALFFDDQTAVPGDNYYYRVWGVNPEGSSESPSDEDLGWCLAALGISEPDFGTITAGIPFEAAFSASGGAGSYLWRTGAESYNLESADSSWIADDGASTGVSGDDSCQVYPLPFDFPFYGRTYDKVWVNSNGALAFDSSWTAYSANLQGFTNRVAIAVLWKDLRTGGRGVTATVNGTESVSFHWNGCTYYSGGAAANASVTLFADGTIVCSYGAGNSAGGFVGISAGDGVRYEYLDFVGSSMANADDIVFAPEGVRGMTLSPGGVLSGTADAAGTYAFTVAVSDAYGNVATLPVSLSVEENPNMRRVEFALGAHGTRVGGGALVQGVLLGGDATAPVVRAASGWVFDGWDADFTAIADNLTVTAQWRPAKPAIRVIDVAAPVAVNAGDDMEVSWTLENWGNAAFNGTMAEEVRLVPAGGGASVTVASVSCSDQIARDGTVQRSASFALPKKGMEGEWIVRVVSALRSSVSLHATGVSAEAAAPLVVSAIPLPDLTVADVASTSDLLVPGGTISVSYAVRNDGAADATGPWTDSIWLVSDTSGDAVKLADIARAGTLAPGEARAESAELAIPETVALAGAVRVRVVADSGDAVVEVGDGDNAALSGAACELARRLFVSAASTSVSEANGSVRFTVKRSGPRVSALVVALAADPAGHLTIPETVTIPSGNASVNATARGIDNSTVEGPRNVSVTVAAEGFGDAAAMVTVTDNETPHLYLTLSGETVGEGGALSGTVRRELVTDSALVVYLSGPSTSRCSYPASVTIPASEGSAAFEISVPDNTTSQREVAYTLRASASGHIAATAPLSVEDDDIPGFTLELYPEIASEGAGPNAVYATLTRVDQSQIAKDVMVRLSQSPTGNLILPASITVPKYTMAVRFAVGTVDNALDDGDREVEINGAVVIEDCGCDGQPSTGDAIRAVMTVIDDDGPALSLKAEPATMKEGLDEAGFLVLSHNSALTEDLEIALSFDVEGEIDIPATATIPAGVSSVRIPVRTLDDGVEDGAKLVSVYAEDATGVFAPASTWLQVSDQNLPDLAVASVAVPASVVAMERFAVAFVVTNLGFMARSGAVPYAVHLVRGTTGGAVTASTLVASGSLTGGIGVDGVLAGEAVLTAPELPGDFRVAVVLDPDGTISELDSANNSGWSSTFGVSAAYAADVLADADVYLPGETITITGVATLAGGAPAALVPVDVYLLRDSYRKTLSATTASDGSFSVAYVPSSGECGHYRIGACYPGSGSSAEQDEFDVLGMKRTSTSAITWDIALGDVATRTTALKNLSAAPLTGLTATFTGVPGACSLEYTLPETVPANGTVTFSMTATAVGMTEDVDYEKFYVRIASAEGVALDIPLYFHSQAQRAQLRATPSSINTTMTVGTERTLAITIYNDGKGDSGAVTVSAPNARWLKILSGAAVENLVSGESLTVTLLLSPEVSDNLTLNSPLSGGSLAVNCANGSGCSVPLRFTPVSESTGSVVIDTVDNYTYTLESAPHLAGATVRITNPYTGALVASGTTGDDGLWTGANIPEGRYQLTITADKHDTYADELVIEPGATARITAFLQCSLVTATWEVIKTEIEDEYEIQLLLDFETQVPAPVVTTTLPEELPELDEGESYVFNIILENTGVIAAEKVTLTMPDIKGYQFVLSENDVPLPAKSSKTINAVFSRPKTRVQLLAAPATVITQAVTRCRYTYTTKVMYPCGINHPEYSYTTMVRHGYCTTENVIIPIGPEKEPKDQVPIRLPGGGGSWGPGGFGGGTGSTYTRKGCNVDLSWGDCLKYAKDTILDALESAPIVGNLVSLIKGLGSIEDAYDFGKAFLDDCTSRVLTNEERGRLAAADQNYGELALDCYNNPADQTDVAAAGYRRLTPAEVAEVIGSGSRFNISRSDGTVTTGSSGMKAVLYVKTNGGHENIHSDEIVVAYAGTEANISDILADSGGGVCKNTQQYEDAKDLGVLAGQFATGNQQLTFVGHSLGGGEASVACMNMGASGKNIKCRTFNSMGLCSDQMPAEGCSAAKGNTINYRTWNDPVSTIGFHNGPIVTLPSNRYCGHSAQNFGLRGPGEISTWEQIKWASLDACAQLADSLHMVNDAVPDLVGAVPGLGNVVKGAGTASNVKSLWDCAYEWGEEKANGLIALVKRVTNSNASDSNSPRVSIRAALETSGDDARLGLEDICDILASGEFPENLALASDSSLNRAFSEILVVDILTAAQRRLAALSLGINAIGSVAEETVIYKKVNGMEYADLSSVFSYGQEAFANLSPVQVGSLCGTIEQISGNGECSIEEFRSMLLASVPESIPQDATVFLCLEAERLVRLTTEDPDAYWAEIDARQYCARIIQTIWKRFIEEGETSAATRLASAIDDISDAFQEESLAVCASITLKLSQTLAMTREAFDGTLTMFNGNTATPVTALKLDISVLDGEGNECKDLFEVFANGVAGAMSGGEDVLVGGLSVAAGGTGSAMVRFIPERGAAPTEDTLYRFGGTVTYIDPFSGEQATVKLTPVSLTVSPSPYLHLDYFVQRDVYADDPFTPDVVEASMPAELAVLVRNNGGGEARNVRISSVQPETVRNEKGLLAAFRLQDYTDIRSALDGSTANLAISDVNLGNIDPGAAKVAQWWLTSSFEGHFTGLTATVTPVNFWNTPDTSLVDPDVGTHKLVRSIVADGDALPDFLTSEEDDLYGRPDTIYTAVGEVIEVYAGTLAATARPEGSPHLVGAEMALAVALTPARSGWNYAEVEIPGLFRYTISKIERADGSEVPLRNAWITDRTFRDGLTPLLVEKLHLVDEFASNEAVSYTVTLTAKPTDGPEVAAFEDVQDGAVESAPRDAVTVVFSTAIDPATFSAADMTLVRQGAFVADLSALAVAPEAGDATGTRFVVSGLAALCSEPGRHELTVQCVDIANVSGALGSAGRAVAWTYSAAEAPYIVGVDGVPRRAVQSLDTVTVVLSTAVDPASFTADALRLDGVAVGAGVSVRALDESGTRFEVSGLAAAQSEDGEHTLAIDPTALVSLDGEAGVAGGGDVVTWTRDTAAPRLLSVEREELFGGVRFLVSFSEDVDESSITLDRFELSRSEATRTAGARSTTRLNAASPALLRGDSSLPATAALENLGGGVWALTGLESAFGEDGVYTLSFSADGVADEAGNEAQGRGSVSWTRDTTPPETVQGLRISPDLGSSDSDGSTSEASVTVLGTLPDDAARVEISVRHSTGGAGTVLVPAFAPGGTALASAVTLPGTGNMTLVVTCADEDGNAAETTFALYLDPLALTATLSGIPADPADVADAITLAFSDAVDAATVALSDFALYHDGAAVALEGAALKAVGSDGGPESAAPLSFTLSGLGALCGEDGLYRLVFDGSRVEKALTGRRMDAGAAVLETSWTRYAPDRDAPFVTSVAIDGAERGGDFFDAVSAIDIAFSEPVNVPDLVAGGWIGQAVKLLGVDADGLVESVLFPEPGEIGWNEETATLRWTLPNGLVGPGNWRVSLDAGFLADAAGNALSADGADATVPGLVRFETDAAVAVSVAAYAMPSFGDFDGDGDDDLLVGEKSGDGLGRVRLFRNTGLTGEGRPVFATAGTLAAGGAEIALAAQGCQGASAALLPRSGVADLVVGDAFGNVFLHPAEDNGWGAGQVLFAGDDEAFGSPRAVVSASDILGSGRASLVFGGLDGKIRRAVGMIRPNAALPPRLAWLEDFDGEPLRVAAGRSAPAAFDLNGDAIPDLVSGDTAGNVWAFLGDGRLSWQNEPILLVGAGSLPDRSRVAVADFSGTGAPTLAVGRSDGSVRLHSGSATPSPAFDFTVLRTPPTLPAALDAPSLDWATGGASPWIGAWTDADAGSRGGHAARPEADGPAADGAWLETSFEGAGRISFRVRVPAGGSLAFAIDGSVMETFPARAGEAWADAAFTLSSGTHEARWTWTAGDAEDAAAPLLDAVSWEAAPWTDSAAAVAAEAEFREFLETNGLLSTGADEAAFVNASLSDEDGDGQNAWAEFVAMTDPTDPDDRLVADIAIGDDGVPVVTWDPDRSGERDYVIEGADELAGPYAPVDSAGEDGAAPSRFYRVKVFLK